jgi:hypothetical protein
MGQASSLPKEAQRAEVGVGHTTNFKYVVWADLSAVAFAFTTGQVDDWNERSWLGPALLAWAIGIGPSRPHFGGIGAADCVRRHGLVSKWPFGYRYFSSWILIPWHA